MIDGARMQSKEALYKHLNRFLCFPEHFGYNLDALWDILTEENEPTHIHFQHVDAFLEEMGSYGEKLVRIFERLNERTDNYTVTFYQDAMNQ